MTDQQISVAPTTRNESGPGLIDWPARWVACDYPERRAVYAQTVSHDGCAACLIAARAAARDQPEEFGWYVGYLERARHDGSPLSEKPPMSARDDYPDPCSTTDQDAMYEEIDELRSILGPLVYPEGVKSTATDSSERPPENLAYELGWVALGETMSDDDGCEAARAMGESIVGSEEMQAIKAVLRHLAVRQATEVQAPTVDVLRLLGLPEIVIDWVLS